MTVEAETAHLFALARAINRAKFMVDEGELFQEVRKDA